MSRVESEREISGVSQLFGESNRVRLRGIRRLTMRGRTVIEGGTPPWKLEKVDVERALVRPELFVGNVEKSDTCVRFVVAQILSERGIPIEISENAVNGEGEPISGYVAIYAPQRTRSYVAHVVNILEGQVLSNAFNNSGISGLLPTGEMEGKVKDCWWDEETKGRILATFWQNREGPVGAINRFGDVEPINPLELRSLLEPVVDRVLAGAPQSS